MAKKTRTPDEVRKDLRRRGVSIAAFARQHQLPQQTVRDLLSEKAKGHRGLAHRAAVLLGMKDGVLDEHSEPSEAQPA